jgi:UDP-3-O-acyl-N-acetylglucosamine deacetylase
MNQNTIAKEVSISGIGIHTGAKAKITLCPAKENSGVVFQRVDLESKPIVAAKFKNVYSTNRSTNIKNGNAEVKTIEHLLASISAFGIDNLLIKINNIEVPILDGSSKIFSKILKESGFKKQKIKKKIFKIKKKILIDIKET